MSLNDVIVKFELKIQFFFLIDSFNNFTILINYLNLIKKTLSL